MKKYIHISLLTLCISLLHFSPVAANGFDSVGLTISEQQWHEIDQGDGQWTSFPQRGMIDLNKAWKITLSHPIKSDKILAAVIESPNGFHPLTLQFPNSREVMLKPAKNYESDTTYIIKIFTSNGKKYKLPFTTKPKQVNLDLPPDEYGGFNTTIDANTYGKGTVSDKKWTDGFIINPPETGKLQIHVTADDPVQVLASYADDFSVQLDASGYGKDILINFGVSPRPISIHVRTEVEGRDVNYEFSSYFTTYEFTEKEQKRINQLKQKWAEWSPQYFGKQSTGVSFDTPIQAGSPTEGALQDGLNMLKLVRYTAGLSTNIELNAEMTKRAQASSIINSINAYISHYPERPENVSDELYKVGYEASSRSNIAGGYTTLWETVIGFTDDTGVGSVGHRSWMFTPGLKEVGFGISTKQFAITPSEPDRAIYYVDSNTSTAHVINDTTLNNIPYDPILWPAETIMPIELMSPGTFFSISLDPNQYKIENAEKLKIRYIINGQVHYLNSKDPIEIVHVKESYGNQSQVIVFKAFNSYRPAPGDLLQIHLTGIQTPAGLPTSFEYETKFAYISDGSVIKY